MSNILMIPVSGSIIFDSQSANSSVISPLSAAPRLSYDNGGGLNITSYTTGATTLDRFSIDGSAGRLFSVSDSLTGTIFSVNDAAGLPIIQVDSDTTDIVNIGPYGTNTFVTSGTSVGIGTASPLSKLHVVGNCILTGQLLGGDYTVGTITSSPQPCISITNNHSTFVDSSVVITPKGTGAFIVGPVPDGTTTGGNARGSYSVDFQRARASAAQVAAGAYNVIVGGSSNATSNNYNVIVGGTSNQNPGNICFLGGGQSNFCTNNYSVLCGGISNSVNGNAAAIVGGQLNTASGFFTFIGGGIQGLANRYGISAHAAGQFSALGDAQTTKAVFRNKTTTNAAVELFLDGVSERYTITSGKVISMMINITGTKFDGSAVAHYMRQYCIKNVGGTTSQVYAPVTIGVDNASGTSIALTANDTNDALKIEVTGVTGETWRWVASVDAVEVGYGT